MVALSLNTKIFIIYILVLKVETSVLIDFLVKIIIFAKIFNYNNIFLTKFVIKFLKYSSNDYVIKLKKRK